MRFMTAKGTKILLEVKSKYTLTADWDRNLKKFEAANNWCSENDYVFAVAILRSRKAAPVIVKSPSEKSLKDALSQIKT